MKIVVGAERTGCGSLRRAFPLLRARALESRPGQSAEASAELKSGRCYDPGSRHRRDTRVCGSARGQRVVGGKYVDADIASMLKRVDARREILILGDRHIGGHARGPRRRRRSHRGRRDKKHSAKPAGNESASPRRATRPERRPDAARPSMRSRRSRRCRARRSFSPRVVGHRASESWPLAAVDVEAQFTRRSS